MSGPRFGPLLPALLALAAATGAPARAAEIDSGSDALESRFRGYSIADVEPVFALTDHTGRRVTEKDFRGEWAVVFFGYTRCADACPWTLGVVTQAIERFDGARPVRPIFIDFDADPERLGPLAALVDALHPRMVGLAGARRELHLTGRRWKMRRMQRSRRPGEVGLQWHHTTRLYLLDPAGEVVMLIDGMAEADQIAGAIAIAQAKAEGRYPNGR